MKELYRRNKILARLGTINLIVAILLAIYLPFNHAIVLGINSVIKPIKFALSISVYSYTMAWILYYLDDKKKVFIYSWFAVIAMCFEQAVITVQALRGVKSHFNTSSASGILLFSLMGLFIFSLTIWTLYMAILFIRQKTFIINRTYLLGIRIGLIYFVVFSMFGGYIVRNNGHIVGGPEGGAGLPFINWSTLFGDLRIAHFFGIHSLQIIPLFALLIYKQGNEKNANRLVWIFSIIYFLFIMSTMVQAILGEPFLKSLHS